ASRGAARSPDAQRALRRTFLDGPPPPRAPDAGGTLMKKTLSLVCPSPVSDELHELALRVREHVIRLATGGGCFVGASLSCTDILVPLSKAVLCIAPDRLDDPDRDYLFLSKGHDVPALYGLLAELGYFPRERLGHHLQTNDSIYWHPNRAVPGVEFHSGSLRHLLSVPLGVALDIRLRGGPRRGYVLLRDRP